MAATAVVVVHGVVPHPPYDMQDQCAAQLVERLPTQEGLKWTADVWQPPVAGKPDPSSQNAWTPLRTITRVYQTPATPANPDEATPKHTADNAAGDFYDVIEAYWSPLDKGKTTAARVISWMLQAIFLPLNTTARYIASTKKKWFDLGYVGYAFSAALVLLVGAGLLAALSLAAMTNEAGIKCQAPSACDPVSLGQAFHALLDISSLGQLLSTVVLLFVAVGFAGAFLCVQAIKAALWLSANWSAFKGDSQRIERVGTDVAVFMLGVALLAFAAYFPTRTWAHKFIIVYFVLSAGSFALLRTLLQSFFVNFFGDVEIYTTHDQNSDFYALREAILTTVTETIGQAMTARDGGKRRYDRVVVLAHSLGSTIAMDAVIRLYTLKEQTKAVNPTIEDDFASIRALVTFGTSLEKTRYFFDVNRPSISEAALQFENDLYGVLFTEDPSVLRHANLRGRGIFWTNLWYHDDPVANEILSYLSFMRPGEPLAGASETRAEVKRSSDPASGKAAVGQIICYNQRGWQKCALTPSHIIIHGLYLSDDWFWLTPGFNNNDPEWPELDPMRPHLGVLDVVTAKSVASIAPLAIRERARFVDPKNVGELRDRY
jgi:hypothetical protein